MPLIRVLPMGSRKKSYFLNGSVIKALPPTPLELNGSLNVFYKFKKNPKSYFFLIASPPHLNGTTSIKKK